MAPSWFETVGVLEMPGESDIAGPEDECYRSGQVQVFCGRSCGGGGEWKREEPDDGKSVKEDGKRRFVTSPIIHSSERTKGGEEVRG